MSESFEDQEAVALNRSVEFARKMQNEAAAKFKEFEESIKGVPKEKRTLAQKAKLKKLTEDDEMCREEYDKAVRARGFYYEQELNRS